MKNELWSALADDLAQLIRLHDRELDAATLAALRVHAFPSGLALLPPGEEGARLCAEMQAALPAGDDVDALAADFAAIYLQHRWGTSPYESVWLCDDHLACGAPMFELQALYLAAGWRLRADELRFSDHLVLQLQYLHGQLGASAVDAVHLGNFIDEHLGYWLPDLLGQLRTVAQAPWYTALFELTLAWLGQCRALLAQVAGLEIPPRAQIAERIQRKLAADKAELAPVRFMPGAAGPGW